MVNRNSILKRLEQLEKRQPKRRVFLFDQYLDFRGPRAMRKEFSKKKYKGSLIIINDIR